MQGSEQHSGQQDGKAGGASSGSEDTTGVLTQDHKAQDGTTIDLVEVVFPTGEEMF